MNLSVGFEPEPFPSSQHMTFSDTFPFPFLLLWLSWGLLSSWPFPDKELTLPELLIKLPGFQTWQFSPTATAKTYSTPWWLHLETSSFSEYKIQVRKNPESTMQNSGHQLWATLMKHPHWTHMHIELSTLKIYTDRSFPAPNDRTNTHVL